ncbi:FecR family protein [Pseudoflavitalea rhizosphaerae]|uniref:FecR family protein n=1 Tax=Pseudoflavitalea rhizosphaerae TaxID=1884793 RepID=UPI000F8CDE6A|nr:FecR family protein [Pseudoflavitalea rhizosphaerae]
MEKRELDLLLKKLAEGSLLPEQASQLQEALAEEAAKQQGNLYAPEVWENLLNGPAPSIEENLRAAQNLEAICQQLNMGQDANVIPLKSRRWWQSARFRAACLVGVIVACGAAGGYWSYRKLISPEKEQPIAWNEVNTRMGERNKLTLGDGTVIYINGGSLLKYPSVFAGNRREVELIKGEIFLEVAPNEAMPFLVKTDSLSVQVLGTSFTVSNRPDGGQVNVAVKTGRVSFGMGNKLQSLLLTPGKGGIFHKKDGQLKEVTRNADAIAGWTKNEFIFEDATLDEVLSALESSFGYHYRIMNREAGSKLYRASFNQHTPQQILHALSMLGDFKYVIRDSTIIVK